MAIAESRAAIDNQAVFTQLPGMNLIGTAQCDAKADAPFIPIPLSIYDDYGRRSPTNVPNTNALDHDASNPIDVLSDDKQDTEDVAGTGQRVTRSSSKAGANVPTLPPTPESTPIRQKRVAFNQLLEPNVSRVNKAKRPVFRRTFPEVELSDDVAAYLKSKVAIFTEDWSHADGTVWPTLKAKCGFIYSDLPWAVQKHHSAAKRGIDFGASDVMSQDDRIGWFATVSRCLMPGGCAIGVTVMNELHHWKQAYESCRSTLFMEKNPMVFLVNPNDCSAQGRRGKFDQTRNAALIGNV